jgi:hypothetical protein
MSLGHTIGRRLLVAATIAALATSACSSSANSGEGDDVAQAPSAVSQEGSPSRGDGTAPTEGSVPEGATPPPGAPAEGIAPTPGSDPATGSGKNLKGPPATDFPYKTTIRVSSTVTPACVEPGGSVELEVSSKPESAVGYHAVYSDGYGGSGAPYGRGYGGNDKGFVDESGSYSSTWVVAPHAPPGPARVDVVIAFKGKWGFDGPHFAVADADGECPRAWLRESDGGGK